MLVFVNTSVCVEVAQPLRLFVEFRLQIYIGEVDLWEYMTPIKGSENIFR